MANKRTLKRALLSICDELLSETIAASLYGNEKHKDNADALLFTIVRMQSDFVSRISHPEPGMPAKSYYRNLREKFAAQAGEIIDQIHNL